MLTTKLLAPLLAIPLLGLLLAAPQTGQAASKPVLRVLAWPGYADADVVKGFERRSGARVELTIIDSDTALWQKISAHDAADFDVFAVNTAELQRYIDRGLVEALDQNAIPNTRRQLPQFRDLAAIAGLTRQGKAYGIPYTYAEMGLIYDRSQFATPPDSITALWDPRHRGRVLAYNGGTHKFSLAAQALGSASPFRLGAGDWPRAVERLIALRRNVLAFYNQPEEAVELFRQHRVALMYANYGMQQVRLLKAAGLDVGYAIPREGALAWLDCWAIVRGVRDRALAHAWIDYMLEETVSGLLVNRQGLSSTITTATAGQLGGRLLWLEEPEDVVRREKMWGSIVSGDRAEKVLAR
ncbi:MAG: extracellular solute-binding protein [Gammaproteobacteria bacterium]|nr:extracellular solute-binding protein [Gammaproteobacteria bacterium]MBU1647306.1 extracellular solute-binding protein [Gammaproteobacteria bacterium]MBU1971051.1 extracellular solute-binding protein [Gammaproteobacteria bacterium]